MAMKGFFSAHRGFWTRERRRSLAVALLLFAISLFVQIVAGRHSARVAANSQFVGDLFLDWLPFFHLDLLLIQGVVLLWAGVTLLIAKRPAHILFTLKAVAVFIIIRAFFINLTHMGIYPQDVLSPHFTIGSGVYNHLTFQGNFFFSGHTGMPFLMALIFWPEKPWRYFFLAVSAVLAVAVLLAHVHYSIDVFASPFITYSIFCMTRHLFYEDYLLMRGRASKS